MKSLINSACMVSILLAARADEGGGAEAPAAETPKAAKLTPEQKEAAAKAAFDKKLTDTGIALAPTKVNCLGLNVTIGVPTSVDDFDKLAGEVGATLKLAISNVIYRGVLNVARDKFCDKLAAKLGIEREVVYAKNEDGTDKIVDGEKVAVKYVLSEAKFVKQHAGENVAQYQPLMDEVASELFFDPSTTERTPGVKKIAKMYIDAAQQIIDKGVADRVAAALSTKLGYEVQGTLESLSAAIKADQAKKDLAGEYAAA